MASLVVVVVSEDEGLLRNCHPPAGVVHVVEVIEVLDALSNLGAVAEFCHLTLNSEDQY